MTIGCGQSSYFVSLVGSCVLAAPRYAIMGNLIEHSLLLVLGFGVVELWWIYAHSTALLCCRAHNVSVQLQQSIGAHSPSSMTSSLVNVSSSKLPTFTNTSHGISVRWVPIGNLPPALMNYPRVAILVPYRNRNYQLKEFLSSIHNFLRPQGLLYEVFVVEQLGDALFNRGTLFNIGSVEMNRNLPKDKRFQCLVLHDVDLIPLESTNRYDCTTGDSAGVWQLSSAIDIYNWDLPFKTTAGGVNMFQSEKFEVVRGFSNRFFGWGGEDDDLAFRLRAQNLYYKRRDKAKGLYHALKKGHTVGGKSPIRFDLLKHWQLMAWREGLSTLQYRLLERQVMSDHTRLKVDVWPYEDLDLFRSEDLMLTETDLQKKYRFEAPPDVNREKER